jgi:hypothetical protein
MSDLTITIVRTSVNLVAAAVRGGQDGIVQQQIRTMGLRQWISFVALWIIVTVSADLSGLHDFITPARSEYLRPAAVKLSLPTPIYVL